MNKKGVLTTYLLIFVIISVGTSLFLFSGEDFERYFVIGESHLELLNKYTEGEIDLFIYEENVKLSLSDSIFELANMGGVLGRDNIEGYSYLQKGSKKCYPNSEELNENLKIKLEEKLELEEIELNYFEGFFTVFTNYFKNYDLSLKNATIKHKIELVSEVKYNYEFNEFVKSIQDIESTVTECNNNITCWNIRGISVESLDEGNIFKIEVTSSTMRDFLRGRDVMIQGAIVFEYNPLDELSGGNFEC